jgi:hypothetical protein
MQVQRNIIMVMISAMHNSYIKSSNSIAIASMHDGYIINIIIQTVLNT